MHAGNYDAIVGSEPPTAWLALRCGPLSMQFDPTTVALRQLRAGDREIVQSIYVAVRDRCWGTVKPQIRALQVETDEEGFRLTFDVGCHAGEIDFDWQGDITGEADGTVRFRMTGLAHTCFWKNRIGLCVLHPIPGCAGQSCVVQTTDGQTLLSSFPHTISPHQPFRNIRSLAQKISPGTWAELNFAGDTFEMEDQRNWTDASFKTYSTPLELPYPVEVRAGTTIVQSVTLTLRSEQPSTAQPPSEAPNAPRPIQHSRVLDSPTRSSPVTLRLTASSPLPLPQIGLGIASHTAPLSEQDIVRLKELALSHLRLDLTLSDPVWETKLEHATAQAQALGLRLEIALFLSARPEEELANLLNALQRLKPSVVRWLLFSADRDLAPETIVATARKYLRKATPEAQIGSGTDAYFAELNRNRPPSASLDCVCYSVNPQVHTFDTPSLVENLPGLAETVWSAQAFFPGLPIVVSPVTLKPRTNPDAASRSSTWLPVGALPPAVDVRQSALFGAGWALGSLKALCESGVHSVTYFETTGWRGVMETENGSPLPMAFPSVPGAVFPLYSVFADVGQFFGGTVLPLESSAPRQVVGMALQFAGRHTFLCANLTPEPQRIRIVCPALLGSLFLRQLDAESAPGYLQRPWNSECGIPLDSVRTLAIDRGIAELDLPAYAYVRLDGKE